MLIVGAGEPYVTYYYVISYRAASRPIKTRAVSVGSFIRPFVHSLPRESIRRSGHPILLSDGFPGPTLHRPFTLPFPIVGVGVGGAALFNYRDACRVGPTILWLLYYYPPTLGEGDSRAAES